MYKLLLILFLSLFTNLLQAEIVEKIEISGNNRVSSDTIKIYGDISLKKDYSEKDLNKILTNLYSTNFFEDVKIKLVNNVLLIQVLEYAVINELIIIGEDNKKYKEQIIKIINLKQKDSFIKNNLNKDVEIIKKLYSSLGFNFVEVNTKIREIDKSNLDLIFEVDKGKATRIKKIIFTGDKKVREKRLRDVIASEEYKFWKIISRNSKFSENLLNLDKRLLTNYYKSLGYYDVEISSQSAELKTDSQEVEITYSIEAGTRYIIKKITTNVDPIFDKDIFFPLNKKYQKIIGEYHSPFKIKLLLEDIDELIEKNNLQFVEHNVEEIIENESIVIKFNIYEGKKILVERINILGNNVTNESVIRSELLIDEGDPFTNLKLNKSISKIKSRNIFGDVESKVIDGSSSDLKVIEISVEEKPTGEVSAGAGIGTNGGSFAFIVKENNWLGEGKNVSFDLDLDQESLRGTLNYIDPNYDFLGNSLNYSISSTTNDKPNQGYENAILSAGVGTTFEQYKDVFAKLGLNASYDDLKTFDNASDSLKKQAGNFTELAGFYGFSFDKRDRAFMPTDGAIIGFDQTFPIIADKAFIGNTIYASSYKTISENVIGAGKFYITSVNGLGEDVRLSKRKNISTKRLRGFKKGRVGPKDGDDFVGGNYAAALNFEANLPRLLPESTKTDIGMFLDFGNVWGVDYDDSIDDSNKIRSSAGAAASWMSPIGPMTFILSTNILKHSTDETESFNFNLGTTF
ncbi:MAG: outer membrane protein assembly factor BamA [Pelagibacteraceae bacterium]|nr:outer membrane protein assembly factor BamA [Pelagibacteraceae bacterium]|tara:strand:+ start:28739 stop:30967 length:2229 start_codon:yes stop_codon:yes gene_type:complete